MSKQLTFEYGDKEYTLEFTKRTVKQMEREGFVATEIESKPMTLLPLLFAGAFKAHHYGIRQDIVDEIYEALPNKEQLIEKLAEMYNDPIQSLMAEPDKEKNVKWTTNW